MPEILFTPRTRNQLDWLLSLASECGIPYREYVKPKRQVSAKKVFLDEISEAAKHAQMIAKGQMVGNNAYSLIDEL